MSFGARHIQTQDCQPDCFGCKLQGLTFVGPDIDGQRKFNRQMATDVTAYKAMRHDGVQPKAVKGAAELQSRAASVFEVESGINLGGNAKAGKRYDEIQSLIKAGETI